MTEAQYAEVKAINSWMKGWRRAWKMIGADYANRAKNAEPVLPPVLVTLAEIAPTVVTPIKPYDTERSCGGKRRYSTEDVANAVAVRCFNARGVSLRVYSCSLCGGFHVTKQRAASMMRDGWRPPKVSERQENIERKRRVRR